MDDVDIKQDSKYQKITALISQGKYKEAMKKLKPMLAESPENPGLLLDAGYIHANMGDFPTAIEMYNKTIKLVPDSASGYTGLGFVYNMQGELEKAIEQFRRGLEHSPDNALIHFEIGEALLELDRFEEALKSYYKAVQFGGLETEAETLHRIAQVHLGMGNPDKALDVSKNVLKTNQNFLSIFYIMAGAEVMKENWEGAKEYLDGYLKHFPDDENAQSMLDHVKGKL
ncbi:MAG: tetratricopeptide repeat protein [Promethearchaeota archaeon]